MKRLLTCGSCGGEIRFRRVGHGRTVKSYSPPMSNTPEPLTTLDLLKVSSSSRELSRLGCRLKRFWLCVFCDLGLYSRQESSLPFSAKACFCILTVQHIHRQPKSLTELFLQQLDTALVKGTSAVAEESVTSPSESSNLQCSCAPWGRNHNMSYQRKKLFDWFEVYSFILGIPFEVRTKWCED